MFDLYLVLAAYKEQGDKLNLVEIANQFCFENEHRLSIYGEASSENLSKKQMRGQQSRRSVETQTHCGTLFLFFFAFIFF